MKRIIIFLLLLITIASFSCANNEKTLTSLPPALEKPNQVYKLDLSNQKLDQLSPKIRSLTKLRVLNLSHNQLIQLPDEIAQLPDLQKLYLMNNKLSLLPPDMRKLKKLKIIDLRDNRFNDDEKTIIKKLLPKSTIIFDLSDWSIWITGIMVDYIWGLPSIILLVGTGLYLTFRFRFIQFRGFKHSIELISGQHDKMDDPGEVSHFKALTTALSATVGTGNIAGVATAIAFGGPGAVFWMWMTALVGMATKYASCTLALKYREIQPNGQASGGPMYVLKYGLNMPKLGALFAIFTLIASFGIGNMVQANSVVQGFSFIVSDPSNYKLAIQYKLIIGVVIALAVGLVIIGGVKRIANVTAYIVPLMAVLYCGGALLILGMNIEKIPSAFITIFNHALNPWAVGGGAIGIAVQKGVARGVFSNEAGLGSAPMAHAAAKTKEPVREGLVAMMGPFIDTIVICTMTALVIVMIGAWGEGRPEALKGAELSAYAFKEILGVTGAWIVSFSLLFFAYSTIIAWSYYGDRSAKFLFGDRSVTTYRVIYTLLIVLGASIPLELVWNIAFITNMLMAVPNLISLILLAGLVKKLSNDYFTSQEK